MHIDGKGIAGVCAPCVCTMCCARCVSLDGWAWYVLPLKALLDGAKEKCGDDSDMDMEITWEPGNLCHHGNEEHNDLILVIC